MDRRPTVRIGSARRAFGRSSRSSWTFASAKLTLGDVIEVPAVVYNYLDETKSVAVSVEAAD